MAKFCGNCGSQLENGAKVCGNCGVPLNGMIDNIQNPKMIFSSPKRNKMKKRVKLVIGMMIFIVISVIMFKVISQYSGYNGLLRKIMKSYETYDIDALISLSSDIYYYGEENFVVDYFKQNVGKDLDFFESSVGHSYKLSYEINEIYDMSDRKVDVLLDEIENMYVDFDVNVIDKIIVVDLTFTAKQEGRSVSRDKEIVMTKEEGEWRLLYIE